MRGDERLRKFFLIFIFLAFIIDNPYTNVFGGYATFTSIPSELFFSNISYLIKVPIPYSIYEWTIFITAFTLFRKTSGFGPFPSGVFSITALYWGYIVFWIAVSVLFLGADRQAIFWDFKGLVTTPFLMFIFVRLFPTPQDWIAPFKVFAAAITLKCLQGLFLNAFVWEQNHRIDAGYLIDHAASYQMSTVMLGILGAMIFGVWRPRSFRAIAGVITAMVVLLLAFVLNERRTEMAGFAASLLLMGAIIGMRRPGATILSLPFIASALALYVALFSNSNSILGKPIQLLTSISDTKDLSNLYRMIENYNQVWTISKNPFLGQGFGRQMEDVAGLSAFLDSNFYLLHPHNSILWLWMEAGMVGLVLFLTVMAIFAFHAMRVILRSSSPLQLTIASVALANLFRYLIFSLGDQLFLHSSASFVLGAVFGAVATLGLAERAEVPVKERAAVRGRLRTASH